MDARTLHVRKFDGSALWARFLLLSLANLSKKIGLMHFLCSRSGQNVFIGLALLAASLGTLMSGQARAEVALPIAQYASVDGYASPIWHQFFTSDEAVNAFLSECGARGFRTIAITDLCSDNAQGISHAATYVLNSKYVVIRGGVSISRWSFQLRSICPSGYAGGDCHRVCPAHSTGYYPNCTCDTGYAFDSTRTNCIPETLAISLGNLGGEVMPTKTRAAYALVASSTGAPKSGAQVIMLYDFIPEEDGYNHAVGQHTAPHRGSLSTTSGTTGTDGKLNFVFTAPEAGGTHLFVATCTNCTNTASGTIKVPGCPVPPLSAPPFTDPVAQEFENGNRWRPDLLSTDPQNNYQTKLACVQTAITAKGGTSVGTSAYRPTEYQRHLYEIVEKDVLLDTEDYMPSHPECQALRNKVTGEMGGHGLKYDQKVAIPGTSRHESGTAFDLTPHGLTDAQLAPIYAGCGVSHTAVPSEPWHTQ